MPPQPPHVNWFHNVFGALRGRHLRVLWLGSLLSFVAFFMSTVVQSVVAFELTSRNGAVGSVIFAQGLAMMALGPFGGAIADRLPKRGVLLVCQSAITLVFVGVGVSIISGAIAMSHLVAAGLLAGAGFAFLGPTRSAYVLELVDGAHRGTAIALNQVALNASRVAGPAIAGALLAIDSVGSGGSYLTMAALYTLAITTTIALPIGKPPPPPDSGILEDVIAGLRYVMGQPRLRTLLLFYILVIMTGFPFITVLPGFVENQLGHPAKQISVLMGTLAAGALTASLVIAPLADSTRALAIYTAAAFGFGVSLVITARMPSLTTTTAAMFLLGVASGTFQTLNGAVVVREADPAFMGRVMSLLMLAFAGFGMMALPVGVLADALGERNALTAMGVCVCSIVLVLSVALARTRSAQSVLPPQAADSAANDRPVGP